MLDKYSTRFGHLLVHLWDWKMAMHSRSRDPERADLNLNAEESKELLNVLGYAMALSEMMELDAALILAQRMKTKLDETGYTARDLYQDISDLYSRVKDQLSSRLFFFVRPDKAKYYETANLFGEEIYDKFPTASDDIEDAGKCLALGLGTSSVMHLMRVMEVGLKALSYALGIPYAPSWESHLTQIQNRIAAKHRKKGVSWKKDESFFRDVSGDLLTVKQAWRNPAMHIDRRYTPDEAEMIFKAVQTFMQRLVTRFDENGKKISSKKPAPQP